MAKSSVGGVGSSEWFCRLADLNRHARFAVVAAGAFLIGFGVLSFRAAAQEAAPDSLDTDQLLIDEQKAFAAAAETASASVVQIETFGGLERVGQELISDGPTTGTVVGKDGWIISSLYSFRQQPASILVSLPDGTRAAARIVARDHSRELALLKIETKTPLAEPTACPMDEVSVGQWVLGLGRTFERESISQSVGIVSALDRAYGKAVQTDAKVSPVNYGGPLIDLQGRIIGVLAPISPGAILEGDSSQLYDSGIGFAVPLVDIMQRLPQMQAGKDVHTGKLGIVVVDQNELAGPVKVAGAAPGSPAAKAGLKPGDTIVAAAGRKVELLAHLRHALGVSDAGSEFVFTVMRKGQPIELRCTLVEQVPTYRLRYLGIDTENLVEGGVRITYVWPQSPAADAQLSAGMRIVGCGDIEIKSNSDLRQQLSIAELDTPLKLKVITAAGEKESQQDEREAPKEIAVKLVTWPAKFEHGSGARPSKSFEGKVEEIELALGDFPNKAWVWCPPTQSKSDGDTANAVGSAEKNESTGGAAKEEFGLLLLLPEPGEVDRNKLRELWEPVVKEGWCVAVIQSGNKTRWSSEEIELVERARVQINEKRTLDASRTVVAGQGVGGRLALVAARAAKGKIAGVMTLGTPLENVKLQRENSPSDSLHMLFVGPRATYRDLLEQLQKSGFPALDIAVPELVPSKWDTVPVERITDWLLGLGRI